MNVSQSMIRYVLVGGLLSAGVLLAGPAFAQDNCKADIAKFCPSAQPGEGRLYQCLNTNKAQLSTPCKNGLAKLGRQIKGLNEACADDVHQYCPGVQPGGGKVIKCLAEHKDQVSSGCKTTIADMKQK